MKHWLTSNTLKNFWLLRDAREQKMLAGGAVAILATLIYSLFFAPAFSARQELTKTLPVLHEQVAQMQALSALAESLPEPPQNGAMSQELLTAALTAHHLQAAALSVTDATAQLQLKAASFAQTLAFLDELQHSARISVSAAHISALVQPDQIDAMFTLQQAEQP